MGINDLGPIGEAKALYDILPYDPVKFRAHAAHSSQATLKELEKLLAPKPTARERINMQGRSLIKGFIKPPQEEAEQ